MCLRRGEVSSHNTAKKVPLKPRWRKEGGLTVVLSVIRVCAEETTTYSMVTLVGTRCAEDECLIHIPLILTALV
jgi:hypothetical protein